ncbi:hypothetical protein U91I_03789 [alpha proteobacterium U9-1i]|nr:hypothetical protein U91I_03789 [alpha proteobacterium U9-1i]
MKVREEHGPRTIVLRIEQNKNHQDLPPGQCCGREGVREPRDSTAVGRMGPVQWPRKAPIMALAPVFLFLVAIGALTLVAFNFN